MERETFTVDHANELAGDLLRVLADHIGEPDSISETLCHWLDVLGARDLGLICMAAVQMTFRDCLTNVPIPDIAPGAVAFDKELAA